MWLNLRRKRFLLIFVHFYWFGQKKLFKQIQIFLRICFFSNLLRKTNFLSILVLLSEIVTFWLKREVFIELAWKCFKTTESIVWRFVAHFEEKQFLLIFVLFYCFEQIGLFTTNPNFPLDLSFSNCCKKTNFLSISELLSEIGNFLTKKRGFHWISPKMLQNNKKA